ncbi:MAG TPA: hypothetical protein VE007_04730 [Thermoanaerobaculia bacterium]|nr:hypothetical protein [Thermoanaerobaculia bacterium]
MKVARPKRPAWLFTTIAVAAAGILFFVWSGSRRVWSPGDAAGMAFGIAAALLVFVQALYPFRRRFAAYPFGTAQRWLQFHIYGGAVGFVFVLVHEGFRAPAGFLGWALLLLSAWSTATGLAGVWLQKWIPAMISSGLNVLAVFDRIPELVETLRSESATLAAGSSEMFERFYSEEIEPALAGVNTSWDYLLDVQGGRERRLAPFNRMAPFLAETERERLAGLRAIFNEKLELDAQYSLLRILRLWSAVHVPPAVLFVALILYHAGVSLYYWRAP